MNANLNQTSYRMHELTRDAAMQSAEAQRLAREATSAQTVALAGLLHRRALRIAAALVLITLALALATQPASAQAITDAGTNEPYHPALVSFRVGIYYQEQGRHAEAVQEFSTTVEAFPMIAEAWAARADSLGALGEYTLAIDDYSMAVQIAPNLVSALNMRGLAYQQIGAFELAADDFQNAIGQMPEYAAPHAGLAETWIALGQYDAAIREYDAYLALAGSDADFALVSRAAALRQNVAAEGA
jgi:tetratricopeptide (TPR) repeat protein